MFGRTSLGQIAFSLMGLGTYTSSRRSENGRPIQGCLGADVTGEDCYFLLIVRQLSYIDITFRYRRQADIPPSPTHPVGFVNVPDEVQRQKLPASFRRV